MLRSRVAGRWWGVAGILVALTTGYVHAKCNDGSVYVGDDPEEAAKAAEMNGSGWLGGCDNILPTVRLGYSNRYDEFITLGALFPTDQNNEHHEGSIDIGVVTAVSWYAGRQIYDLGYMSRGMISYVPFLGGGLELGLSYLHDQRDMAGVYVGLTLGLMIQYRFLRNGDGSESSLEFGWKY